MRSEPRKNTYLLGNMYVYIYIYIYIYILDTFCSRQVIDYIIIALATIFKKKKIVSGKYPAHPILKVGIFFS